MAATYNDIPSGPQAVVTLGTGKKYVPGDRYVKWIRLTGDSSYPAGGYPLPTTSQLGFARQIDLVAIINQWPGAVTAGNIWFYNTVTQKAQLIVAATGVELVATSSVTDAFCDLRIEGK